MNRAQLLDAPVGLLPLPRPLMTAEVLDAAFRLFRAGILRCLPYSGLAVLVLEMPALSSTLLGQAVLGSRHAIPFSKLTILAIALLLSVALVGLITLRLSSIAQGVRPRFRTEVAVVVRRWPMALLATLLTFGYPLAFMFVWPLLSMNLPEAALIFAAIPLLWPVALLAVALPAFWCDRLGPFAAMARAIGISRRRSWRMAGALLTTGSMVLAFYVLSALIAGLMSPLFGRADLFLIATVASMLGLVVGAFGVPFILAVLIVAYQDLKLRDEDRRRIPA